MQWWCSWHAWEARNFRRAPLPATVWQREVGRIGPVAVPIPQHPCEELFLQSLRRTICSSSLDHAGSSVTFQQINLCIFDIKEGADESGEVLRETEGRTIFKPTLCHRETIRTVCFLKITVVAAVVSQKLNSWWSRSSCVGISITLRSRSD